MDDPHVRVEYAFHFVVFAANDAKIGHLLERQNLGEEVVSQSASATVKALPRRSSLRSGPVANGLPPLSPQSRPATGITPPHAQCGWTGLRHAPYPSSAPRPLQ